MIIYDTTFDDDLDMVQEHFPQIFKDNRGYFTEVVKTDFNYDTSRIRQINRSSSSPCVFRGMHAQRGRSCQSKLVESLNEKIYDIITDARPNSKTFGTTKAYLLDPEKQNKVYVPRGFLHGFLVPETAKTNAVFMYYCDNLYNRNSEVCINPLSIIPTVLDNLNGLCGLHSELNEEFSDLITTTRNGNVIYSEKDKTGEDYHEFMDNVKSMYEKDGFLWYR